MGKLLIINTGPTAYEQSGDYPVEKKAGQYAPPEKWAEAALERIAAEKVCAVYFCPVPGAKETAAIISGKLGLIAQPLAGLENVIDPAWKGMTPDDALKMESSFAEVPPGPRDLDLPFTRSADSLRVEIASVLDTLTKQHKKEPVLIVSHRMLTPLLILHLLHMANHHYRQVEQEYGALNLFEVRSGMPSAIYINDTCHLHGLI